MILEEGNKVLVVHRRLFENDASRFFVGMVDAYEAGVMRVTGRSWIKEEFGGVFISKQEDVTKIYSVSSGTLIVYRLPEASELASARFETSPDGRLWLVDKRGLKMDLSEKEYVRSKKK